MTSTPASRSAREITLIPRSCPSRPTLAVRMRILRPAGAGVAIAADGTDRRDGGRPSKPVLPSAACLALHAADLVEVRLALRFGALNGPVRAKRGCAFLSTTGERRPAVRDAHRVGGEVLLGSGHLLPIGEMEAIRAQQEG